MPRVYPPEVDTTYKPISKNFTHSDFAREFTTDLFDTAKFISRSATTIDPDSVHSFKSLFNHYKGEDKPSSSSNTGGSDDNAKKVPNILRPYTLRWVKIDQRLGDKSAQLHTIFLGCISDFMLALTNMLPYTFGYNRGKITVPMTVSLDHSMWFHREFRVDEWLLFELESPRLINGRGFLYGNFYNQNGLHVATIAQENLFRSEIKDHVNAIPKFLFSRDPPKLIDSEFPDEKPNTTSINSKL
ncbi:Acyl-coenzyme A thioesterase 8 [Smittium culicis]|uniref:Acyl-coenzyme A thioesterase 8 n=1 Tax=Smittium culicis TaxID=133412 RepID=A0A1R1YF60_9FUNG|nr:Acyl-coenzyme A thioesterase 8 [Smittium culicis]